MNPSPVWRAGAVFLSILVFLVATNAWAGGDWNDEGIAWRDWDEAVVEAKKSGKPICMVVYTETCPHCTNYSRMFHDEGVLEVAKDFVMVRIDQHASQSLAKRFAPDGAYIPRTLFFTPDGEIAPEIQVDRPKYVHFYDEHDPAHIRDAMKTAHPKLTTKSAS